MQGYLFSRYLKPDKSVYDNLLELFLQLLNYTSGDANEALQWLNELDREYKITDNEYGMGDFIRDLKDKGFITDENTPGQFEISSKTEQVIRKRSLEEIFGKLKKGKSGNHKTSYTGAGDEWGSDFRSFQFGDSLDSINYPDSFRNAHINHGIDEFNLTEDDLVIREKEFKSQTSTVIMIDISHSMILYGEDRITPAKKVAMALSELIISKYKKDTLDIVVFGNDAWQVEIKDLPYLKVGPYHTNTYAGLELAMDLLRRRKNNNKQIFMITDGKPTCLKENGAYYKNSFGLDRRVVNKTLNMAGQCRRLGIPVTTFMIAKDPYLQQFVKDFTKINNGRAYYSSLSNLGEFIFEDFERNRKKTLR
jgi:Ca-activated chloride channel family protein